MNLQRSLTIILLGVFLSILMSGPSIVRFIQSDGYDPGILSDWDEAYYLPLTYEATEATDFSSLLKVENGRLKIYEDLKSSLPHVVTDLVVGKFASSLDLRQPTLGILLDLSVFPITLILLSFAFYTVSKDYLSSIIGALVTLLFPWAFALSAYDWLAPTISEGIKTKAHHFFPSEPVFRAVYTQLSYPFFSIFLLLLFKQTSNRWQSWLSTLFLGISAGLLLYIYFFAWGSALALLCTVPLANSLVNKEPFRLPLMHIFAALFVSFVVSFFGFTALTSGDTLYMPGGSHLDVPLLPYSKVWFISPIELALLIPLLFITKRSPTHVRLSLAVFISCITSEHVLMNMQPLLNRWLTPYHFPLFYLHPIISGIILCQCTVVLSEKIRKFILIFIVLASVGTTWGNNLNDVSFLSGTSDVIAELKELDQIPNRKTIATLPYLEGLNHSHKSLKYLLFPYWIEVFTKHDSFSQFLSFSDDRLPYVKKELWLGLLYTGKVGLVGWCPAKDTEIEMKDILYGADSFNLHQRRIDCAISETLIPTLTPCNLLMSYNVDLYLTESRELKEVPSCEELKK